MYSLQGKTAIVTGATGGICYTVALTLAAHGARVAVAGRSEARAREVAEEIKAAGGQAIYVACDICDEADRERLLQETVGTFGTVDILVNGAATWIMEPALEVTEEHFNYIFKVNTITPFLLAQCAAKQMVKDGHGGRIINIASTGAFQANHNSLTYNTSKSALVAETAAMASEWARYGITANCVAPGMTLVPNEQRPAHVLEATRCITPTEKLSTSQNIADAIAFLASDEACNINGVTIPVDGGLLMLSTH